MDTRSKRYRRAPFLKGLAFVLACLCVCSVIYTTLTLFNQAGSMTGGFYYGLDNAYEAAMQPDYTAGSAFAQESSEVTYILQRALSHQSMPDEDNVFLGSRVWYYAEMTPSGRGDTFSPIAFSNTDAEHSMAGMQALSPYFYAYENGVLQTAYSQTRWYPQSTDARMTLYIAFQPAYISAQQYQWDLLREALVPAVWTVVSGLVGFLLLFLYLTLVAGRKGGSEELHLSRLDDVYSDFLLVLLLGFIGAWAGLGVLVNDNFFYDGFTIQTAIWFCVAVTVICVPMILALWLSIVRKIKAGKLLRHTLIWTIISGIGRLFVGLFRLIGRFFEGLFSSRHLRGYPFAKALFWRQCIFICLSCLMVVIFTISFFGGVGGLAILCIFLELVLVFCYIWANNRTFQDMEKICDQAFEIYQGNMEFDPGVGEDSPLGETSRHLLEVGTGMEKAMQRQLSSERMKIALVTNVSHDLKTPLTSIIGYIDLLQKDEALSPEARDYVTILANKSQRLKTIIEDLFDLAKTTSGDDSGMTLEVLDLKCLAEQTLADMEDNIARSGQAVRTELPELPVFVRADGRKLYRVIQNIMDNALKYSMPGTRIYVSLSHAGAHARMVIKNTASYEMDFTAEEILERFVRGDRSRSTEGSGLGLSIAQGFTRALGGDLKVSIDGDQFRVELTYAICTPPRPEGEDAREDGTMPATLRERMDVLKGKLYKPRADAPARVLEPAPEAQPGHFEPEKPVALAELESVLDTMGEADWQPPQTETPEAETGEPLAGKLCSPADAAESAEEGGTPEETETPEADDIIE